MSREIQFKIHI